MQDAIFDLSISGWWLEIYIARLLTFEINLIPVFGVALMAAGIKLLLSLRIRKRRGNLSPLLGVIQPTEKPRYRRGRYGRRG
jgi:hypothetical protein